MSDTSGPTLPPPLARWDRDSSSWRTSPDTSLWDLPMSLGTLPRSGMTRDGSLYELPMPELPTVAPVSSSLSTPQAADGTKMSSNPETSARRRMKGNQASLTDIVQTEMLPPDYLLPTPTVVDRGANMTPEEWAAWTGAMRQRHGNGNGHGASLTQEALALLPTPKATNNENQQRLEQYGPNLGMVLMPDQYEWTGAATPPPSPDGSDSPDPHPHLPFPAPTGDHDSPPDSSSG